MKFAIIGDIHSNKYALDAVLKDIQSKDVDAIFSTGDLVGYLPHPNEVIDLMRAHRVVAVQGNHDEMIANAVAVADEEYMSYEQHAIWAQASKIYTSHVITSKNRAYLKQLPKSLTLEFGELSVMIVHGSHRHNMEYLYEDETILQRATEDLHADVLICGHTHVPYHKEMNQKHFINIGSVGKPKTNDDLATYTIVDIQNNEVTSSIEKVSYDVEALCDAILETHGVSDALVENIKKGF